MQINREIEMRRVTGIRIDHTQMIKKNKEIRKNTKRKN